VMAARPINNPRLVILDQVAEKLHLAQAFVSINGKVYELVNRGVRAVA